MVISLIDMAFTFFTSSVLNVAAVLLTAVVIIMTHYYDNCLTDCGLEVSAERGKPQVGLILLDLEQEVFSNYPKVSLTLTQPNWSISFRLLQLRVINIYVEITFEGGSI